MIAITGGAGYIGSALSRELYLRGVAHVVLDDLSDGRTSRLNSSVPFHLIDINNTSDLQDLFRLHSVKTVIHCAGVKSVAESESNPEKYFHINSEGTKSLLNAMVATSCTQIIFASTAAVYDTKFQAPETGITEDSPTAQNNVYGASKLLAEKYIREYSAQHNFKAIIFRYFNVIGSPSLEIKDENDSSILPKIFYASSTNQIFEIYGDDYQTKDGTCIRDYLHINDLNSAHISAIELLEKIETPFTEAINLGSGKGVSVREIVSTFELATGKKIDSVVAARRVGDIPISLANLEKANLLLQWKPVLTIREAIESIDR